jgi:hypothetical protein
VLEVGGDDAFILAWGRSNEALRNRSRQLLSAVVMNCALVVLTAFLVWRNEQKETYVFVRDAMGNVVQGDSQAFLHAGDARSEVELKGFMRRWVLDAFTWTPLDVQDRLKACLAVVDSKAHAAVKLGLKLGERRSLVDGGSSGRVYDDPRSGREPQAVIVRMEPLEVMVSFERFLVDSTGAEQDAGQTFVRALLKRVPRSPANPYGLVIADAQISERL